MDVWRLTNPREQQYTFYLHNHKMHSRIDYFLISKSALESVIDSRIGVIALTDHATVELCLTMESQRARSSRWRLNTSLFQDLTFKQLLLEELKQFFRLNVGSTERIDTVWEASKAFIRGKIIAYPS